MARKRKADSVGLATIEGKTHVTPPKRPKKDLKQADDGKYYSISSQREYDPVTRRAITKPKGPQGNRPQNVKGIGPYWDLFQYSDSSAAPIMENIECEVKRLQNIVVEDDISRTRISELERGSVPFVFVVIYSAGILLRVQVMIRDVLRYHLGGHYLECHFAEGRGPKLCVTFRSMRIYDFVRYLVGRFEEETQLAKYMTEDDLDAEGETDDEAVVAPEKDIEPDASSVEVPAYDVVNTVESEFALRILKPDRASHDNDPSSGEINDLKLMQTTVKVPGGFSACKTFAPMVNEIAKEFTGWYDLDGSPSNFQTRPGPYSKPPLQLEQRGDHAANTRLDLEADNRNDVQAPTVPGSCKETPIELQEDDSCSQPLRSAFITDFEQYVAAPEFEIGARSMLALGPDQAEADMKVQRGQSEGIAETDEISHLLEALEQDRSVPWDLEAAVSIWGDL